jgi:hypothetical protein
LASRELLAIAVKPKADMIPINAIVKIASTEVNAFGVLVFLGLNNSYTMN